MNTWIEGALYYPGGVGGIWTQPGGPGTTVFPQQQTGNTDLFSPAPFNENTGQFTGVCGHSFSYCTVYRDYDQETDLSVALLACPLCSCIQRAIEPYDDAVSGSDLSNLILYP